jgi:hypothetical protein
MSERRPLHYNPVTRPVEHPPGTLLGVAFRELELAVHCPRCRRIWSLSGISVDRLLEHYGDLALETFAARVRCTHCRHRGARLEVLEPLRRPAGWQPRHGPVRWSRRKHTGWSDALKIGTLGTIHPDLLVRLWCRSCNHVADIPAAHLTMPVMAERGMNTTDKRLARTVEKRVGSYLRHHRAKGTIVSSDGIGGRLAWSIPA